MNRLNLISKFQTTFNTRIVCLVGYGSYFYNRKNEKSDIDLCLLLDKRIMGDTKLIREIVDSDETKIDITVHYLDEIETIGWENFSHGTHGIFFLKHLAYSDLLIGEDIFSRMADHVDHRSYVNSLHTQTRQYIDRLQVSLTKYSDEDDAYYIKYITRIMINILLLVSAISFREINHSSVHNIYDKFISKSDIFSNSTKKLYSLILNGRNNIDVIETITGSSK